MIATTSAAPPGRINGAEKAITLALSLAQAERAIHAFSNSQVDAIVDTDGQAYLLRPAQEQLRQSERRLQAVIDSAADVITVVNRAGRILSQSRAVTRLLGYEPEELVGSNIFELIYEEHLDELYTAFFNVIEGFQERATIQFYHAVRGGTCRLIEATLGRVSDDASLSVVFILRPIAHPGHVLVSPGRTQADEAQGQFSALRGPLDFNRTEDGLLDGEETKVGFAK